MSSHHKYQHEDVERLQGRDRYWSRITAGEIAGCSGTAPATAFSQRLKPTTAIVMKIVAFGPAATCMMAIRSRVATRLVTSMTGIVPLLLNVPTRKCSHAWIAIITTALRIAFLFQVLPPVGLTTNKFSWSSDIAGICVGNPLDARPYPTSCFPRLSFDTAYYQPILLSNIR